MDKNSKIYVAGHNGLVGSALARILLSSGYLNVVTRKRGDLDLTHQLETEQFFAEEKPDYVFLAAAKVGGIYANNTYPADFININLAIQQNVINAAYNNGVKRLLFLGSSCIYPRNCPQPIKEEYLLTGQLEPTNRPYAIAKIAGIEQCWAFNRQYGTKYLAVMPTNLYGPGDNYDLLHSHVLPALIRKMHEAKKDRCSAVTIWGTGTPRREFLYVDDMADACVYLMSLPDDKFNQVIDDKINPPLFNVGCGSDIAIKDLALLVKDIIGFSGVIDWDTTKPDGTPQRLLNVGKIASLGWESKVELHQGIAVTYKAFLEKNI